MNFFILKTQIRHYTITFINSFNQLCAHTPTIGASYTKANMLYRFQPQDLLNEEHTESKDTDRTY